MSEIKKGNKIIKINTRFILGIVGFFVFFEMIFGIRFVGAGQVGVVTKWGAVQKETLGEGMHFVVPFRDRVKKIDLRTQKKQVDADAASKDLQSVRLKMAVNYRIEKGNAAKLFQEVGKEYEDKIVTPAIEESIKAGTAKFTAEELITKRSDVNDVIKKNIKDKLEEKYLNIDSVSVVDFQFSDSFDAAIERKVTAEQNALAAKNQMEQKKYEAQQAIIEAEGKAKAMATEAEALKNSPNVLELKRIENERRAIERWNGSMPTYSGGATPFINLNK